MIRPLEWDERVSLTQGLDDLFLKVYLPDGSCVYDRPAREEVPGRYVVHVLFGPILKRPIFGGPVGDPVAVDGLSLDFFINAAKRIVTFGHEDGSVPLDSEEAQGGLLQQLAARSSITARLDPAGPDEFILTLESNDNVTLLGGSAAATLKMNIGDTNFVKMIGQRVILRWHSIEGSVDDRYSVVLTDGMVSDEVLAVVG